MFERKVVVALATSLAALAYVAAVHVVAAIKYFDNGEEDKKEEEKDNNSSK